MKPVTKFGWLLMASLLTSCTFSFSSLTSSNDSTPVSSTSDVHVTSSVLSSSEEVTTSSSSIDSTSVPYQEVGGMLFDHGTMGTSQYYNYAPSMFEENGIRYVYFCSNFIEGNVTDVIGFRKGEYKNGAWVYSDFSYVLASTPSTWDSRHTCDPSVIKGQFTYRQETYQYLMAYLGCVTSNNQENEIGLAVAHSPEGPWIKTNDINPIANYTRLDNTGFQWGYGQPSLVSVDRQSRVLMFYTVGNGVQTYSTVERWDFANLDAPVKEASKMITTKGLKTLGGSDTIITNAEFAYDPVKNRMYMISDDHPFPTSSPDFIAGANVLAYMNEHTFEGYDEPGDTIFSPLGQSWSMMTRIGQQISGYPRNHNMGFLRDPYGWVINPDLIPVIYTVSIEASGSWWYWSTYRLFLTPVTITE